MRKLATIRTIDQVSTHPNADALDLARLGGWQVVVKRGQFRAGDLCVYCEIDSVLPDKAPFAFLKDRGFRIKTIKLRGQISQGICFHFDDFLPEYPEMADYRAPDDDVGDLLGVTKYDPPLPSQGDVKGAFPGFLQKTDAERVQNLAAELERFAQQRNWLITEKLDGTSFTAFLKDEQFGVCSRNFELEAATGNLYWNAARAAGLESKLRALGRELAVQGEIVGTNVQGNKYHLKEQRLFVFHIIDLEKGQSLDLEVMCAQLGLTSVPVLAKPEAFPWRSLDEIIAYAGGPSKLAAVPREGVVICTADHQILFKSISNDFLLKHGE